MTRNAQFGELPSVRQLYFGIATPIATRLQESM